ncbi:MAG: DUF1553 domain-containing protein [Aureliella sp.]
MVGVTSARGESPDKSSGAAVDFAADIRPLLSDRCFLCHGPDAGQRATDLRLDRADSAHESAIVPGDVDASELIERILSDDEDYVMPPPDSKLQLSDGEKDLLRRWIQQGAQYEQHWSFVPPKKAPLPTVQDTSWPRKEIDYYVLAQLEERGWTPSPEADRRTLIRRLTFDLTGLPPTPDDIEQFVQDERPDAYERLVDQLLSRKAFGERWATDWLDVARYADTYGYQNDRYREMWQWRDWVVDSYNNDLPYDDFIRHQVAGDLLPDANSQTILATAFNRNHRQTNEGGSVEEEFRAEYVADRVNTFGAAFLGLTLECSRCHDHKYDPISQSDYYSLAAYFNSIDESGLYSHFTEAVPTPTLLLPTDDQQESLDEKKSAVAAAAERITEIESQLDGFDQWKRSLSDVRQSGRALVETPPETKQLADSLETSIRDGLIGEYLFDAESKVAVNSANSDLPGKLTGGPAREPGKVGNGLLLGGENGVTLETGSEFRREDPFSVSLWINVPERYERAVVFHRSRAWTDSGSRGFEMLIEDGKLSASLIHFWPGNAISIRADRELKVGKWTHVTLTYDGSSRAAGLNLFLNGSRIRTTTVRDKLTKHIKGADGPSKGDSNKLVIGNRFRDKGFKGGRVDQFRVYDRQLSPLELRYVYLLDDSPDNVTEFLHNASEGQLRGYFGARHPQRVAAEKILHEARRIANAAENAVSEIMVMQELPRPRPTFVLIRGAYDSPGQRVERRLPEELAAGWDAYTGAPDRRQLAAWLTDPENPLVSRVAVNRFWQALFGVGIVATSEDFGMQGEAPSHPQLLDYLARDFVDSGWNVKDLLKQIVMSSTYRQSSDVRPELFADDPQNRSLARGPSFRLSAEMIRDAALAYGGLLVDRIGGPPVKPYQPEGLWKEKSGQVYNRDLMEGSWRRSLYTYWKRTSPPPSMMTFDATSREVCAVRRQETSTPLQALVLLNDPQFVEAARAVAAKAIGQSDDIDERLSLVFATMVARTPSSKELKVLREVYDGQLDHFSANPDSVVEYLWIGDFIAPVASDEGEKASEKYDLELAALASVAGGLFSFDEVVMKR